MAGRCFATQTLLEASTEDGRQLWVPVSDRAERSAGATVAGLLEPAYEVGGDCLDYALNSGSLSLAVFDAMGHGLPSSVISSLAVGTYRHARRALVPLEDLFRTRCPCSLATACCSTPTGSSRPGHRRARSSGSTA